MSQDWGKRSDSGGQDSAGSGGATERYYMNKAYGRSLDRARALDVRPGGQQGKQQGGEFQRATIEPEAGGGHKVIVEHSTTVIGGGRDEQQPERSEHSFTKPEDALQFLQDVLHERLPGEPGDGNQDDARRGSEPENAGAEQRGSGIEDLLEDAFGGAGGRG